MGSTTDNITLGQDRANIEIIPSILVFEKAANYHPNGMEIPEAIYKYGSTAETLYPTTSRFKGFQSIKKLLGFRDIKEVVFENKSILRLKGKDLASLLVKGLFKDIHTYFNSPDFNDDYKRDGKFSPLRAGKSKDSRIVVKLDSQHQAYQLIGLHWMLQNIRNKQNPWRHKTGNCGNCLGSIS